MNVNSIILANNPFFDAYIQSDYLGKLIFLGLIALSIVSWIILIHKVWITYQAKKLSLQFQRAFLLHKANPLSMEYDNLLNKNRPNPHTVPKIMSFIILIPYADSISSMLQLSALTPLCVHGLLHCHHFMTVLFVFIEWVKGKTLKR